MLKGRESPSVAAFSTSPESGASAAGVASSIRETDDARLRRIVRDHYDFVWRALRRLGTPEAVTEDAAQRVFLVMSKKLAIVALESERSFLFGTAVRVASDARRTNARLRQHEVPAEDEHETTTSAVDLAPNAEVLVDEKRARLLLDRILDSMPDEMREVFVLCAIEELTAPEASEALGIPEGTIRSRLRRARELFEAATHRIQIQAMRKP